MAISQPFLSNLSISNMRTPLLLPLLVIEHARVYRHELENANLAGLITACAPPFPWVPSLSLYCTELERCRLHSTSRAPAAVAHSVHFSPPCAHSQIRRMRQLWTVLALPFPCPTELREQSCLHCRSSSPL